MKVVGGFDFVGDDYDGSNTPQPDPNPLDCNGHGTHVGGTAAGYGVNSDGSTYRGPYDTDLDLVAMRIGPGMAPTADLWALRVFGCEGSTNVVGQALEYSADPTVTARPTTCSTSSTCPSAPPTGCRTTLTACWPASCSSSA